MHSAKTLIYFFYGKKTAFFAFNKQIITKNTSFHNIEFYYIIIYNFDNKFKEIKLQKKFSELNIRISKFNVSLSY